MKCDSVQIHILNALLDIYERSIYYRDDRKPDRRIMLRFYTGGKTDFAYYDIEQSERRVAVNRAVEGLAEMRLASFSWMSGEYRHIIDKVWLNTDSLVLAYEAASRAPKSEAFDNLRLEIERAKSGLKSEWANRFLQETYDEMIRKRSIVASIPAETEERRNLFTAISAIDSLEGVENMERVFSLRTFGDSKVFERSVRSRLIRILRKYTDNDNDVSEEDILKQVGIVKYPEQFEFCGRMSVYTSSGQIDFSCLPTGGVVYSSDFFCGLIKIDASVESILTIENRANYIDYIRKSKHDRELVIYHGGQYSPRKRMFLQSVAKAISDTCIWRHWSDIDYGGFIMLSRIRREIMPTAASFRMDTAELVRYGHLVAPIKPQYADRLGKLKTRPELADCYDCIDYMIENRIGLEQEAMLTNL